MNRAERLETAAAYLEALQVREYGLNERPYHFPREDGVYMNRWGSEFRGPGGETVFVGCLAGWLTRCPALREEGLGQDGFSFAPYYRGRYGHGAMRAFFGLSLEQSYLFDADQAADLKEAARALRSFISEEPVEVESGTLAVSSSPLFGEMVAVMHEQINRFVSEMVTKMARDMAAATEDFSRAERVVIDGQAYDLEVRVSPVAPASQGSGSLLPVLGGDGPPLLPLGEAEIIEPWYKKFATSPSPEDLAFAEATQASRAAILGAFQIPPRMIGLPEPSGYSVEEASALLLKPFRKTYSEAEILEELARPARIPEALT